MLLSLQAATEQNIGSQTIPSASGSMRSSDAMEE